MAEGGALCPQEEALSGSSVLLIVALTRGADKWCRGKRYVKNIGCVIFYYDLVSQRGMDDVKLL